MADLSQRLATLLRSVSSTLQPNNLPKVDRTKSPTALARPIRSENARLRIGDRSASWGVAPRNLTRGRKESWKGEHGEGTAVAQILSDQASSKFWG
jgi:hypothetical protein